MKSEEQLNYNISAYRILYLLLLLTQHRVLSIEILNNHLFANPLICKAYNSETITKYINTLRQSGCQIPRSNRRGGLNYELKKYPFPIQVDPSELRVAQKILLWLTTQADESLSLDYHKFLQKISWLLVDNQQEELLAESASVHSLKVFHHHRVLLSRYRKYCQDALIMEVKYETLPNETIDLTIEPYRVVQEGRRLYLLGSDRHYSGETKLNLERIISVKQLPSKVQNPTKQETVIFKLSGRLAKTYRLYPGEEIIPEDNETQLKIKARTDNYPALLKRITKYGTLCEIISPACVCQAMKEKIEAMLSFAKPASIK